MASHSQSLFLSVSKSIFEKLRETVKDLMELGPNFVPKTKVTSQVLREVEVWVERLAFGKRWQAVAEAERIENGVREENEDSKEDSHPPV